MIKNIEISRLRNHPNNPRKDLGDLTELAESIKVNGIFQNLTIVPQKAGYCISCKLYNSGIGKCTEGHDKNERPPCAKWEDNGYYDVVIGNRRLAASKLAGLTEVPCAISDMDEKTQQETMLMENMQRNDLTLWEQAQGFQMLLDLGDSIVDISARTGFSETTVRRRIKLLELDSDKLKKSVERGATLMDYIELERIQDVSLRNSVLDKIGTPNFRYELQRAIDQEKNEATKSYIIAELEKFATKTEDCNGYQYVICYYPSQKPDIKKPTDAESVKYYFTVSSYGVTLYKERSQTQNNSSAIDEKEKARRECRAALDEISKRAYQLRHDFIIKEISNTKAKKNMSTIIEYSLRVMLGDYCNLDYEDFTESLGIEVSDEVEDWEYDVIAEHVTAQPERHLLVATYMALDSENAHYYNWQNQHEDNEELNMVYDFIEKLGYEMSDEEKSLRDGTHELFGNSEAAK